MSEHRATIAWSLSGEFRYEVYSRSHMLDFGREVRAPGDAAPENVPQTATGAPPTPEQFAKLHEQAHERCFIANSVKTRIILEPRID